MTLCFRRSARFAALALSLVAAFVLGASRLAAVPAFPGAEGFGLNTSGGRGGTVYHVTNLNDSGAGSFRDAVSVAGRTVVFDVGGIITLSSPVVVKSNITIAGQTAPGEGITLYGDRLGLSGVNNLIMRYIRVREGINGDSGTDTISADSGDSMIFDHVSASWGRDETFSFNGSASHITLQDCIIGQGLLLHSAGGLVQTDGGVSIFRCLYIDNYMRNPKVKGVNDYQNNVVYNWGDGGGYIPAGDSAGFSFANMIGNYFISGPVTSDGPFKTGNNKYSLYHSGNFQDLNKNGVLDGTPVTDASFPTLTIVPTPFAYPAPQTLLTAQQAFAHVLANAGASLHRDHADVYMLNELASIGTVGAQIFNESEIGGVGTVAGALAAKDTDGDGMPDWWESAAGTNPAVADNNGDLDGDGYTNLENYLNALGSAGVPAATISGIVNDTGSLNSDGVTSDPTLILRGTAAPGAAVTLSRVDIGVIGTATADGSGQWTFDYTGTPLANRFYAFTATVALPGGLTSPPTRAFVVQVDTVAAATPAITSLVVNPAWTINGTSEPGSVVTVTRVGVVGTATTDPLGNWSALYTGPALPPGSYTFTAVAVDLAGNTGATSAPYTVNTALAAPVFTGIVSDSGASANDQITNDTTLTFNGTSFAGAVVTLTRVGTGVIGTATANGAGAWSFVYPATLPQGTVTFTATAATGGSSSPASPAFSVTIDTTRPVVSSIRRLDPLAPATTASTLIFRVTFAEPVSGVDAGDFALTLSGATGTISTCTPVSTSIYDVTVTGVAGDGTVRLDLKSSGTGINDVAGNASNTGFTTGQTYTIRLPGSGVWISEETSALWGTATNWESNTIASGVGATADFGTLNIEGDRTVVLDSSRTVGRLVFGDIEQSSPGRWIVSDAGNAANQLTLSASGSPSIQVNYTTSTGQSNPDIAIAGAAYPAILDVAVNTSAGLTKSGWGTAILNKIGTFSGPIAVTQGRLKLGTGGVLTVPTISLAVSTQFEVAGGTFTATGDANMVSGTGVGYIVSGGTASFQKIIPTNARNNLVKVSGGTMTATELNFPRSADAFNMYSFGLVIEGGETTIGTVGLGTANSWGAMSVEGGRITIGQLFNGFQQTSGRGGQIRVLNGELIVTDPTAGLVMSRKNGSNANNTAELHLLGGVTTLERLTLGYDATVDAGVATVNVNGGALYLGTGGIVRNGVGSFATNSSINLLNGTLGAKNDWSTNVPFALPASNTIAIRAADATGLAHDITLSGGLSGAGGFTKTGDGALTLTAANTFTGGVAVNAGILRITNTLVNGAPIDVNAGGSLVGDGTLNRLVNLNGTITPSGATPTPAFHGTTLTWNGGGRVAFDLGGSSASSQLILTGPLTKGSAGLYEIALNAGSGFAVGNVYTVATFASTDFNAADFTVTGLPSGYAAAVTLTSTSLQLTIVGTPFITSPTTATGTYGTPFNYTITAGNGPTSFSASGLPTGLGIDSTTGVISGTPGATGSFNVTLGATNIAGTGSAPLTLTIAKAAATVTLSNLTQRYDGTPKPVTATTEPAGLNVTFTYNGETTVPKLPGSYAVVATIDDANYQGSASGTLTITITALIRHAPNLNGDLDGSLQLLTGESFVLNGNSFVSGDLLVPGTPHVQLNGHPSLLGTQDESGATTPTGYNVTLNGNALARYVVRRVDAIPLTSVTAPQAPAGTRDVVVNSAGQSVGDFATLRNLTLNSNAGLVSVPAGAYGNFTANGSAGFVLGVVGATEPSVYDLQRLTLNSSATLQIVGPVVLKLGNDLLVGSSIGSPAHPEWLRIEIARGGVTLNGNSALHAEVLAPAGNVIINGNATLHGRIEADRLTINGRGLLTEDAP